MRIQCAGGLSFSHRYELIIAKLLSHLMKPCVLFDLQIRLLVILDLLIRHWVSLRPANKTLRPANKTPRPANMTLAEVPTPGTENKEDFLSAIFSPTSWVHMPLALILSFWTLRKCN